tara:strand:+ start:252 stop:983 length:732 start_codon:yes stop_codon:yes gene_type:complete
MWLIIKKHISKSIVLLFKKLGIKISKYTKPSYIKIINKNEITVIFDVGANSGQFGKILRENGYKKKIISFEPTKVAHQNLIKSSLNDNLWIIHQRVAIGNENKKVKINVAGNNGESSSVLQMGQTHKESAPHSLYIGEEDVDQITIDTIFEKYVEKNDKTMLKIDVQGYEDHVLEGVKNNINKIQLIKLEMSLVSLYQGDKLFSFYISKLETLGFKIWDIEPGHRKLSNGRLLQFDAVFVKSN